VKCDADPGLLSDLNSDYYLMEWRGVDHFKIFVFIWSTMEPLYDFFFVGKNPKNVEDLAFYNVVLKSLNFVKDKL